MSILVPNNEQARALFPAAGNLLGDYFHQDYEGAPEDVLRLFVAERPKRDLDRTLRELELILAQYPNEDLLGALVYGSFACSFDVLRFKPSYRAWLEEIIDVLRASVANTAE